MKTYATLVTAGICGLLAASAFGNGPDTKLGAVDGKTSPASEASHAKEKEAAAPVSSAAPAGDVSKTSIASSSAEAEAVEAAKRAHIKPGVEHHTMETPPPAPRQEMKPASPAEGLVWVPGHWRPEKGDWTWVSGEWGFPPTSVSVWIEPRYDPATKQWSAGYWQPDREERYVEETAEETPLPVVKF